MAAVFESLGKTNRETEYAEYKANRAETPDDLHPADSLRPPTD